MRPLSSSFPPSLLMEDCRRVGGGTVIGTPSHSNVFTDVYAGEHLDSATSQQRSMTALTVQRTLYGQGQLQANQELSLRGRGFPPRLSVSYLSPYYLSFALSLSISLFYVYLLVCPVIGFILSLPHVCFWYVILLDSYSLSLPPSLSVSPPIFLCLSVSFRCV